MIRPVRVQMTLVAALLCIMPLIASVSDVSPVSRLAATIRTAVDVQRGLDTIRSVYSTDRWFTFPKFEETAAYLKGRLEQSGARNVVIEGAKADGRTQAGFWTMPLAWDVTDASLVVTSPERIDLCQYRQVPSCLGMWSGPTPPGWNRRRTG